MRAPRRRARAALAAALAALAAAPISGCGPPPFRVVLVGDSITAGYVSDPPGPPYAVRLAELLGPGFEVVNVACSGSSAPDWRPDARPAACEEHGGVIPLYATRARPALPADVATVLLGTNDTLGSFEPARVEPQAYEDALRALVQALHADGAREVVLLSPPALLRRITALGALRARVQALCGSEPWLHCGPDLVAVLESASDFAPRNVHPNGPGHEKIAVALAETLRALAAQPR